MHRKYCTQCIIVKNIGSFHTKNTESKNCKCRTSLKRYYENKEKFYSHNDKNYILKKKR